MSNDTYHGRALAEAEQELGGRHARLAMLESGHLD